MYPVVVTENQKSIFDFLDYPVTVKTTFVEAEEIDMNTDNNALVMFHDGAFELDVRVSSTENTVWLTLDQIASLFEKDKSTVSRHIKNIFSEEELVKEAVVANYATTATDGKTYQVDYYNLDVIISVGYRVKSKRGIAFRKWATSILNDYLIRGYAENKRFLEAQGKTIELQTRIISHLIDTDEEELMNVINQYTAALDLLDDYDHQSLVRPKGSRGYVQLSYEECLSIIDSMKFSLSSAVFGTEKTEGALKGILGSVYQSVFGEDVYPSVEEKAATLLYFLVKDHPFNDGCKRIGATLFLAFLQKNGMLFSASGKRIIANGTLVAVTLMIAESRPEEKDVMVTLLMNLLNA